MGRLAVLLVGFSLVDIFGQVVLGCRQADACLSLVCLVGLACCAHGEDDAGVGRPDHGGRGISCGCGAVGARSDCPGARYAGGSTY